MITLAGFALILCIILLLGVKKTPMIPTFIILPIVFLFVLGYKPSQIGEIIQANVYSAMTNTGLLLMFSIMFFSVLSETGVFDKLVDALIRLTKGNAYAVLLCTVLVATVGQLDGSLITTFLISIPPLVPLYDRIHLDKRYLLFLTSMVLVGFQPEWSGALQQIVALGGVSAHDVSAKMLPTMVTVYVLMFVCCFLFGRHHIKQHGNAAVEKIEITDTPKEESPYLRPKLLWFNVLLLISVILCLSLAIMPTYVTFMLFLAVALAVNYPKAADQSRIIKKYASAYLNPIMLIVCINVLVGVMQNTGISAAFAETLISWIPESLLQYTFLLVALLIVPICRLVPYQVLHAMIPFIVAIEASCGVSPVTVMAAYGCNTLFGTVCSPYVAQTHLGVGLLCSGNEDPETMLNQYVRFAFPTCMVLNVVVILISFLLGVYN